MSVVSDFATKNLIFLAVLKKIYGFYPFLAKNGHFSVTKYLTNHYKLPSVLAQYGSINLLDHLFCIKSCSNTSNKTAFNQINCIFCLFCSLKINILRDKNDVKIWHFSGKSDIKPP